MAFTLKNKVIGDIDLLDGSHSSAFQAAGNELSAIQALADTAGFLKKTGDGAYTIDTTTYLSGSVKLDDLSTPDDNTDLDASTTRHGLLLKAVAPASGLINVVGLANGETIYKMVALFDATVPSTQAYGDSASAGSAVVSARRDHKHAMPAAITDATISTSDVTTNDASTTKHGWSPKATAPSAGMMNVLGIENGGTAHSDKALFDVTSPSTQAFGDSATVGSAMTAARRDHKHAMPANPVGNELAAIQALADTAGFLKKTGDGTYTIDTASYQPLDATLTSLAAVAATALNDFIVATGADAWTKKTLAETKTILGIDNDTFQTMTQKTGQTVNTNWAAFDPTTSGVTFVDGGVYVAKIKVTGTTTTSIIEAVSQPFVWKTNGPGQAVAQENEIPLTCVSQSASLADLKIFLEQYSAGSGGAWSLKLSADSDLGASAKIDAIFRRVM